MIQNIVIRVLADFFQMTIHEKEFHSLFTYNVIYYYLVD